MLTNVIRTQKVAAGIMVKSSDTYVLVLSYDG
jgi:hypothetical protein